MELKLLLCVVNGEYGIICLKIEPENGGCMMRIVIDGDGCPVKEEAMSLAANFDLPILIVTSVAHYTTKEYPSYVQFVYVDKGTQQADYAIMNQLKMDDILITHDYGLASMAMNKCLAVFHHSGNQYLPETIDFLLEQRYHSEKMRKARLKTKGPKTFTQSGRAFFKVNLRNFLLSVIN